MNTIQCRALRPQTQDVAFTCWRPISEAQMEVGLLLDIWCADEHRRFPNCFADVPNNGGPVRWCYEEYTPVGWITRAVPNPAFFIEIPNPPEV